MSTETKKLYRSRSNRVIGGVCAGLGEYLGIDITVVRLFFALGAVFGFGSLIVVYLVMLFIVPEGSASAVPADDQTPVDGV
jgi:phage shock protein PspC (stress-responsive transcriptional regulator)